MTAGVQAAAGVAASDSTVRTNVTLADLGGAVGNNSLSVPVRTSTLTYVDCITSTQVLRVFFGDEVSQSFFTSLKIQDGSGATQTVDTASATFSAGAGQSGWSWDLSSLWALSDVGESKLLQFIF